MKTFRSLAVAAVAVPVLAGPGFAQTSKPVAPPAASPAAASAEAAKAAVKTVAGELVSVHGRLPGPVQARRPHQGHLCGDGRQAYHEEHRQGLITR